MMKYYQEITLIPDAEIPPDFLWTKVYAQIHLAFADRENIDHKQIYGVSFPEYADESMGEKARVFAPEEADLKKLDLKKALRRLSDYVHITSIREVPESKVKGYVKFARYQPDSSIARKARRYAKRHPEVTEKAAFKMLKQREEKNDLPFIQLKSLSTGQTFNLFVKKEEKKEEGQGGFTTYGLSKGAAVPEF